MTTPTPGIDAATLLALEPEEIGPVLLQFLATSEGAQILNPSCFRNLSSILTWYFRDQDYQVVRGLAEDVSEQLVLAWDWLRQQGLLVEKMGSDGWYRLTRRGRALSQRADTREFGLSRLLPRNLLHGTIDSRVWPDFIRGDYQSAVLKAFKAVEVTVREAAGLADTDIGTALMRKAFAVQDGPLSDMEAPTAERQALSDLLAGAIGSYKNPSSHRDVEIGAAEAAEMIVLASHLLKIAESRRPAASTTA